MFPFLSNNREGKKTCTTYRNPRHENTARSKITFGQTAQGVCHISPYIPTPWKRWVFSFLGNNREGKKKTCTQYRNPRHESTSRQNHLRTDPSSCVPYTIHPHISPHRENGGCCRFLVITARGKKKHAHNIETHGMRAQPVKITSRQTLQAVPVSRY